MYYLSEVSKNCALVLKNANSNLLFLKGEFIKMKRSNLVIDVAATVGKKIMCVGCKETYAYDSSGKRKDPIGMTYDVVLADDDKGFDHLDVVIEGANKNTLPELNDGNVQVSFDGLEISVSVYEGKLHVKGKARAIKPATSNRPETMGQGGAKLGH